MSERLETTVSGSFKFKNEIDGITDQFTDCDVIVLEPARGWLYVPSRKPQAESFWKPLPNERGLEYAEVEDRFLSAVRRADFAYIYNPYGYLGLSGALEMGFAAGCKTPLYRFGEFTLENFEFDLGKYYFWSDLVTQASPAEAAESFRRGEGVTFDSLSVEYLGDIATNM